MLKNWKKNLLWLLTAVSLMLCAGLHMKILKLEVEEKMNHG